MLLTKQWLAIFFALVRLCQRVAAWPAVAWVLQPKRLFVVVFGATLVLKSWIAVFLPITSDEAFFALWAKFPNWGYYDHPPMVGWFLWLVSMWGTEPWQLRSVTVLLTSVLACGVVYVASLGLLPEKREQAWLAGCAYLTLPVSWFGVMVTTDTPLMLFMGLSMLCYVLAWCRPKGHEEEWPNARWMLASGVFLGLAFLSKYFAVLLGIAYAVHALAYRKSFKTLLLLAMGVFPFVALNVVYNAYNCWNNIMFNLINRHGDAELGFGNLALYAGMMLYLLTPWVVWQVFKARRTNAQYAVVWCMAWVPLFLFLGLSLSKTIGLHWVLGFVPAVFVLLAWSAEGSKLRWCVLGNIVLSVPHAVLLGFLLHANPSVWPSSFAQDVMFHRHAKAIVQDVTQTMPHVVGRNTDASESTGQKPPDVLATTAYSPAALLTYHAKQVVPVFGPGKYHARNDDVFVDWREHNGKHIRIVSRKPFEAGAYQAFFERIEQSQRMSHGLMLFTIDGYGFRYTAFRDDTLRKAWDAYYRIPTWLPVFDCPFACKYGFEDELNYFKGL